MLFKISLPNIFSLIIVLSLVFSCGSSTSKPSKNTNTKKHSKKHEQNTKMRNGEQVFHYPNGNLWSTSTYKDNIRHGKTTSYYENGQLRYLGFYHDGKKSGQWFFYSKDGTFKKKVNYDSINKHD